MIVKNIPHLRSNPLPIPFNFWRFFTHHPIIPFDFPLSKSKTQMNIKESKEIQFSNSDWSLQIDMEEAHTSPIILSSLNFYIFFSLYILSLDILNLIYLPNHRFWALSSLMALQPASLVSPALSLPKEVCLFKHWRCFLEWLGFDFAWHACGFFCRGSLLFAWRILVSLEFQSQTISNLNSVHLHWGVR